MCSCNTKEDRIRNGGMKGLSGNTDWGRYGVGDSGPGRVRGGGGNKDWGGYGVGGVGTGEGMGWGE